MPCAALFDGKEPSTSWYVLFCVIALGHHGIAALFDGKEPVTSWYALFYVIAWGHHGIAALVDAKGPLTSLKVNVGQSDLRVTT